MYEVAQQRCAPVSIRLVDNMQFQFGLVLKPPAESEIWLRHAMDAAKKHYILHIKKFKPDEMCAATLLFEGNTEQEIREQEKRVYGIAAKFGGLAAGAENGIRGYFLTYMIAYLRDFGFNYSFIAESFETSVPWSNVEQLCTHTKQRIADSAKKYGVQKPPFVSCRVTQTYDTGACVYFYFGFQWRGLSDPVATFTMIEHDARDEILKWGGSVSHHHGIGKLRQEYMPDAVSDLGVDILKRIKHEIDPKNVFGAGNLGLTAQSQLFSSNRPEQPK